MGFKDFMHDLGVIQTSFIDRISKVQRSEADGLISFEYRHVTLKKPAQISLLVKELSQYPRKPEYMLFTSSDYVVPELDALTRSAGPLLLGKRLHEAVTIVSRRFTQLIEGTAALPDADADSHLLRYPSSSFSEVDLDALVEDEDVLDSVSVLASQTSLFKLGANGQTRLKQDLKAAQAAGISVGVFPAVKALGTVISLSIRTSTLGLSQNSLEAWHMKPSDFVILLAKVSSNYAAMTRQIGRHGLSSVNALEFRIGKSCRPKLAADSVEAAFSSTHEPETVSNDPEQSSSGASLEPLYMSKSLESLLNGVFLQLLETRLTHNLTWNSAQAYMTSLSQMTRDDIQAGAVLSLPSVADNIYVPFQQDFVLIADVAHMSLPLVAFQFALFRLIHCTSYCMVCHKHLVGGFEAVRPFVCDNALCFYQYVKFGFGINIEYEVVNNPYVVDLLVSFFYSAAAEYGLRVMPSGLDLKTALLSAHQDQRSVFVGKIDLKCNSIRLLPDASTAKIGLRPHDILHVVYGAKGYSVPTVVRPDLRQGSYRLDPASTTPQTPTPPREVSHTLVCRIINVEGSRCGFEVVTESVRPTADGKQTSSKASDWVACIVFREVHDLDTLDQETHNRALLHIADELPSVSEMRAYLSTQPGRRLSSWNRLTPSSLKLFQWIVASNKSFIIQDGPVPNQKAKMAVSKRQVAGLPENWMQFRFSQGSFEKELEFQKAISTVFQNSQMNAGQVRTLFAWHGSSLRNWHSIIRSGLDFTRTVNGRSYGHGVYFSPRLEESLKYCDKLGFPTPTVPYGTSQTLGPGWRSSQLHVRNAISICEIVNQPQCFVSQTPHYVVNQTGWIQCRYLFVELDVHRMATDTTFTPTPGSEVAGFVYQDPARLLLGRANHIIQIPLIASSDRRVPQQLVYAPTGPVNGPSKPTKHIRPDEADLIDLGDDLDAVFDLASTTSTPDTQISGSLKRTKLDDEVMQHDPTPSGNAPSNKKKKGSAPNIARDFVPGSLDIASLPQVAEPEWAASSVMATNLLQREIKTLQKTLSKARDIHELGWSIDFGAITNLFHWIVELHSFENDLPLAIDMKSQGITSIVLEVRFGGQFNLTPPFVRVIRPRFLPFAQGGGGHVTEGGAICSELLTNSGWVPSLPMEKVFLEVRLNLCDRERPARLLLGGQGANRDYDMTGAVAAYKRAARAHKWKASGDLEQIASQKK